MESVRELIRKWQKDALAAAAAERLTSRGGLPSVLRNVPQLEPADA
jgi:hypothetical protein